MAGIYNPLTASTESLVEKLLAAARSRTSWNERLTNWEKPASDSEEAQIERAAGMVRAALAKNRYLADVGATVLAQGSYHNNTNVRQGSDMDIRVVHPHVRTEYATDVNIDAADRYLDLAPTGGVNSVTAQDMRRETVAQLVSEFGQDNVHTSGNKAIRVKALPGSRPPVDVVAGLRYFWICKDSVPGAFAAHEGFTFQGKNGNWVHNYPEQHQDRGIAKGANTKLRFKKCVRSLKWLRDELVETGVIDPKQVPSYLIECLAHAIEDEFYLIEADDRYDRILRLVRRLDEMLNDSAWTKGSTEINGIKYLFHPSQPWTVTGALVFVRAANQRLTAAA